MEVWLSDNACDVRAGAQYMKTALPEVPSRISVHAFVSDAFTFQLVTYRPGTNKVADVKDWPRVTLGEIRAWLKEKAAEQAKLAAFAAAPGVAEHILEAVGRREAQGLPPITLSPGANADAAAEHTAPTEAAAPGVSIGETTPPTPSVTAPAGVDSLEQLTAPVTPREGDHVTGVGIQTPARSFPAAVDDDIPF